MCFSFGSAKAVEIVSFNAASSEAYVGAFVKGIKATAEQYGYDITVLKITITKLSKTNKLNNIYQVVHSQMYSFGGHLMQLQAWVHLEN